VKPASEGANGAAPASPTGGGATEERDERHRLIEAMEAAGWVQAKAARLLGITPRQIGYALRKFDVTIKRF
jgi:Nif-specific regulatory protein